MRKRMLDKKLYVLEFFIKVLNSVIEISKIIITLVFKLYKPY